MANLNVDYSKGLFANTNTILTESEQAEISYLRQITEQFSSIVPLDKVLLLDFAKISNIPEATLLASPLEVLTSFNNLESTKTLACAVGSSIVQSISNNASLNYTVFNTSTALQSYTQIIKDACSTLVAKLKPDFITDDSVMLNIANSITESLSKNVTTLDPYSNVGVVSLDNYMKACASHTKLFIADKLSQYDVVKRRQIMTSYIVAFYVFFIVKYVTSFIRTSGETDSSGKPQSFIVRQFAILTLKVYLIQIILLLIQVCQTSSLQGSLKNAIRTLLYSIASEYNTQEEFNLYYQEIMSLATANKETRDRILSISKDVDAAKNNIEKAVVNDQQASKQLGYTKTLMYIWFVLLVLLIVAVVVLLIIGNAENNMFYYMYIVCGIFVVSVFINALVQIVSST